MLADPRRRAVVLIVLMLAAVVAAQVLWTPDEDFGLWFVVVLGAPGVAFAVQATLAMRELTKPGAEDRDLLRALTLVPFGVGLAGIAIAIAPAAFTVEGDTPGVVTFLLWVAFVAIFQFLGGFLIGVSFLLPASAAAREIVRRVRGTGDDDPMPLGFLLVLPCLWVGVAVGAVALRDVGLPYRAFPGVLLSQLLGLTPPDDPQLMWAARVILVLPLLVVIPEWISHRFGRRATARAGARRRDAGRRS